ncbi:restriction endonuclease subunit S [Lactococcus garvieae]|uniref:restriction endonuclease subunit S n=1 Tax=Lactococcus garvieae TaxID=1363 RepID=UPI00254F468D|nr:restriction endonuclease subunit S [Lactococcus garvieae]
MMSKKSPQLRFEGFTDDWEERKLSDLFIKGGSGGTPKSTNKAFYDGDIPFLGISDITKSNGFINNTEKHISSDGLNSSAAWIVSKGAISLAMYASVGKLAILNIDAATSQAFYNMIFDDYDLRDLVYQRLNKANELSEWNKLISTGTQSNLNADKVKNFQMYLPKNHDEIKLISTFFKQIDNTIALHQRKLDLLKEQKKGYLQKMFPKNGAKVPELRFAGFVDDWEQRKLSSMTDYKNGKGHEDKQSTFGKLELINLNSISISGGLKHSGKFIDEANDTLQKDDLVMILSDVGHGDLLGRVALIPEDNRFVLNQRVALLRPNATADPQFLFSYINAHQYYFKAQGAGMSQLNISKGSVENFISFVPIIEEQKKIGSFFKELDDAIALHQRKLDLLKEQKKGFLQKMFV